MTELLAPNGKPSNLSPEQYELVRTPAFKEWFGDWENSPETSSKIVDENGEPLPVYHGTNTEFYKFDKSKGKGSIKQKSINFSSKIEVSKDYGSKILECFLNIRNPYIKNYNGESYWTIESNARHEKKLDEIPDQIVNKTFDEKIYDGVIFVNIKDSKSRYSQNVPVGNNYYAFNNKQIKLADGTNTTFDVKNTDIRFDNGGSVLLAPNGKPSNLSPEQYKLVRSESFKAWFGDWENLILTKINDSGIDEISLKRLEDGVSKVVDSNGEPLVVYHGTNNDFYTFDKSKIGLNHRESKSDVYGGGFFFTDKKNKAFRGSIKEVFLKIKKPLFNVIEDKYGYEVDYYHATDTFDLNSISYFQRAKENRNNGIIIKTPRGSLFVAFEPEQIKLADGTNTTFDGNNPDIRFDGGGAINKSNDFIGTWEELKKYNPNLWETGILRRSQNPQGATDIIPKDVFIRQFQWQNYGQYDEIEAETIYGEPDNYGYYNDKDGNPITDERTGNYITDELDYENNAERIKATISNKQLKNNLIDSFQTQEGKEYLKKVIATLPKNEDGTITAYRIGTIGEDLQSYTLSEGMAKTFSNQGTDIMPSGLPSIPNEGYKDYGVLPVNKVKINPKGIVAWSPYDSEILVELKYIKTDNSKNSYADGGSVYERNLCQLPKINLAQTKTEEFKKWWNSGEEYKQELPTLDDVKYRGQLNNIGYVFNYGVKLLPKGAGYDMGQDFGFYFVSENANDVAKYYAYCDLQNEFKGHLMAVWLRLHTPFEIFERNMTGIAFRELLSAYDVEIPNEIPNDSKEYRVFQLLENYAPNELRNNLKKAGFDGVIFADQNEIGRFYSYVVFMPNQIKSATENIGTFDNNNPDIRFDNGGIVIQPIENKLALNYLSRISDGYGQFIGKNGKLFYIQFNKNDFRNPSVKVFDGEKLNDALSNGYATGWIAIAFFNVDFKNKTFSGYSENHSIQVDEEYRRLGIATAMTDFAEEKLGMKYVPSKLLSKEMQGFVNNRFNYEKGGDVKINPTQIECHNCHWKWKVKDGGDDLFICHKCYTDNSKFYKFEGLQGQKILDTISYAKGGRTIAQTPAPKKERIYGSEKNKPESSKDTKSAEKIEFNEKTLETIKNKVAEHNEKNPKKKVTLASAKAVVRRGMGAYSSSHRPTIKGGKPNSRVAWGLARLNAFLYKIINGKSKSGKYNQDDDLINELGYKVKKYEIGGIFHGSRYRFDKFDTNKIGSGIGQQDSGWGIYLTDDKESSKSYGNYIYETTLFEGKKIGEYNFLNENEPVKKDLVRKIVEALYKYYNKEFDINKFNLYYEYIKDKSLPKVDFNDYELIEFYYSGYLFYKTLSRKLGGDKKASLFLLNNGIDGSIKQLKNHKGEIYRTDYVIYDENAITINNTEYSKHLWSDGGDIQAYQEAMGISEFDDGGETKPKKVYVSIKLPSNAERIWKKGDSLDNFNKYFYTFDEAPFQELKNGKLLGLVGVSTSPNNIAEWFIHRDCLIVMNYDEFMAINETETINYYDPYQLMKNDLYLFRRLYANVTRYGEQNDSVNQTIKKILEKIVPEINLEMNLSGGQKYSELYRISRFLSPYETGAFPRWIENNKMKIESPIDLTNAILDFNKLDDSYLGSGYENPVLTFDELLPIVEKGITNASKIYESEHEIVLINRELNIPKKSQLFFIAKDEVGQNRDSNRDELIQKYNLKELYKVYFVDRKEIQKYRDFWVKKEEEKFNNKLEQGRKELELKKEQVLDELLNYFLDKSISYIKNELEKEYLEYSESLDYYDETDDDSIEQNLFSIPLVESIMNTYILIIKNFWKSFIQKKQVKNLDLYAFDMFYFNVKQELKNYFENKKDELEKLNNYRNTRGGFSLDPYRFERLLLKTIDDYEKLPELIDYKELAKMYLDKMGREIYRYYDKNDLKLVSQYKDGGETDEPTHFWGNEAGGVLIYCSTTDRYLILLRSDWVTEPNTWGIVSGKLDEDEDKIQEAVYREAEEEIGYKLRNLIPTYIFQKPNFKFHNFVSIVNEEFIPELNWENTDYKWVKLNEIPDNIHFGLKKLLENEDIPKLVKKHRMENEILVIDMNMYRYDTSVNFKNKEIPLKLNAPINQVQFIEWAEENDFEFEQWGDAGMDDVSWGYTFEVPLNNYIEYLKTEKYYTGGELKKGIKTEMEHKETIKKIKTGDYTIKESAELIAKDHLEENDKYYTNLLEMEKQFADGGKVENIKSKKGDIKLSLDENWYLDDTDVELVPVSELIKFREFDRKVKPKYNQDNSRDNINHLKFMFQKEGVKSPLIIEYSPQNNSVLIIEGNHRLNSAIDLGMEYLPARVVLKKYGTFTPNQLKNTMQVSGVKADESGYIKSSLKPSEIGIEGVMPIIYREGGIIEGRLHSECGDDGCGRKFQVGEGGHIIEAERDEAVIVADTFNDNEKYTIEGTPSEIASALNVMGGGKNFDKGATIVKNGEQIEIPQLKKEAKDTDVDDIIDSGSIIINRRSMADENKYEVTGTPKQIASAINSINGNGVVIQEGATIKKN